MTALSEFSRALTAGERKLLAGLTTPAKIQAHLDELPYSSENRYRSPLTVVRDRVAHCFDGALFAAAALRRLGHAPRILDLLPNGRDDDHLLALFQRGRHWGAIAKSNFSGLRYREPVYASLRELAMSYFEQYFNSAGEKTLRGYTVPLNLAPFDPQGWMIRDEPIDAIAERLDHIRHVKLLTPSMIARLSKVDGRSWEAGMVGVNQAGLYKPK